MFLLFPSLTLSVLIVPSQVRSASGIKGLFHKNPKQSSLDSHAAALHSRKPAFGAHLLRRTASAPTKGQPKVKRGFPEISIDTKDFSSEGASSERESEEGPAAHTNGDMAASAQPWEHGTNGQLHMDNATGKVVSDHSAPGAKPFCMSEPLRRASRFRLKEPLEEKKRVFALTICSSGRLGMKSNCLKCVNGSKESPKFERKVNQDSTLWGSATPIVKRVPCSPKCTRKVLPECISSAQEIFKPKQPKLQPQPEVQSFKPMSRPQPANETTDVKTQEILSNPAQDVPVRNIHSCKKPCSNLQSPSIPAPPIITHKRNISTQHLVPTNDGRTCNDPGNFDMKGVLSVTNWSSCSSLDSLDVFPVTPSQLMDIRKQAVGTLQREMNSLFAHKMEEIHSKSPLFFPGKITVG